MKNTKENKKEWVEKVRCTLELGGRSKKTFDNYKSHINRFLNHYKENTEINELTEEDIIKYLKKEYLNLNRCASTINLAECSIKFLFSICFDIELNKRKFPSCKLTKRVPTIISKALFIKIFNEETNLKHKCWLIISFCSGLRVDEVAKIHIDDIDVSEHKLKVLGKGNKERYTILPDVVIKYINLYLKKYNISNGYIFKGNSNKPYMNSKTIINYFSVLKDQYNLNNNFSYHSLRHSFATYYLKNGGTLLNLQSMLGHKSLNSTIIYLHLSQNFNDLEGIKYV